MDPMWIVLADEGRARILECKEPGHRLEEVEELTDAAAHADNADLRRDAYGRRGGGDLRMGGNATASAGEDKLDHEAELFARRLADRLSEARRQHRYGQLRIAAAPRFLGRLRKAMEAEVSDTVVDEIDKDWLQLDPRTLAQRLFPGQPEQQRNG